MVNSDGYIFYEDGDTCYLMGYTGDDTELTLPANCNGKNYAIYKYAFYRCSSLESITIPNSVTSIGYGAFSNTAYYNDSSNWEDGVLYIGNHLIEAKTSVSGSYDIKEGTKDIADNAFYGCTGLVSITIPNSVTSIGEYAFYWCSSLKSITIPNSVTSIGASAFSGCTGLTSITIPNSVTSIGDYAFDNCRSLTSITIPNSVTSIGEWTFYECSSLTSITIPDSVKSIGDYAFCNCYQLIEVYNLSKLNITTGSTNNGYVGYYAKNVYTDTTETSKLWTNSDGYIFYEDGDTCYLMGYTGDDTELTLPANCNGKNYRIYNEAFYYCSSLTSITIPNSVTSIGYEAFYCCSKLTSITIPDSVTSIGGYAFAYTAYYKDSSNWENGVLYIGNYLIEAKTSVSSSYNIKKGTKCIASIAFASCTGLTSITIPDGVTSIGSAAFFYCRRLKSITIPNSVTSIGSQTFYGCSSLTSVTIPDSVTRIDRYAFEYCSSLRKINFKGTKSQWKAISKGVDWNSHTGSYTVYCTNGNISKSSS